MLYTISPPCYDPRVQATREVPVVMKFGGSSVADLDKIRNVAERIVQRAASGPVVVVVSAMGKTTDGLVAQATALQATPDAREMDMLLTTGERTSMALLALAVRALGQPAISLTGSQCGIITTHRHGRARIVEVRPFRILDELAAGHVVIVGGFQGVSYKREVTTLGRGGSDTTAVALAAALGADCEIYSDVDGVYSTDPRVVPEAIRVESLSFEEMRALSRAGAKVLHAQAVQLAEEGDISIFARATDGRPGQTEVRKRPKEPSGVRAIACDPHVVIATVRGPAADAVLRGLSELGFGNLHLRPGIGYAHVSLSARDDHSALQAQAHDLAQQDTSVKLDVVATVAAVGTGIEDRPEVLDEALRALSGEGIDVVEYYTDTVSLTFVVDREHAQRATAALHAALIV